jgi:hypothetical protein
MKHLRRLTLLTTFAVALSCAQTASSDAIGYQGGMNNCGVVRQYPLDHSVWDDAMLAMPFIMLPYLYAVWYLGGL